MGGKRNSFPASLILSGRNSPPDLLWGRSMESLSIAPAVWLMLPATLPFILVFLFLLLTRRAFATSPEKNIALSDLITLGGLFLSFGLFDFPAIRHLLNPNRPMDWIPLLTLGVFLARIFVPARFSLLAEFGAVSGCLFLLMLPIAKQEPAKDGAITILLILALWIVIRGLYPVEIRKGLKGLYLTPLFFSATALAIVSPISGSLLLGQLAGGLAAVFTALGAAKLMGARFSAIEPGWVLGALLVIARQYAEFSLQTIGPLAFGLLLGGMGGRLAQRIGWPSWKVGILVSALSLAACAYGVVETINNIGSQGGY